jgi:DNA-binding transcriptional LysR family regulator
LRSVTAKGDSGARIWRVKLTEAIAELAEAGQGIGIISRPPSEVLFDQKGLRVLTVRPRHDRTFWGVWPRASSKAALFASVIEAFAHVPAKTDTGESKD